MQFDNNEHPHRRYNPLIGEWILVSPHRAKRPWQGQKESANNEERPHYDPTCYLCAGNLRSDGTRNDDYKDVFVFDNDFPSLLKDDVVAPENTSPLFQLKPERGINRVICFSPRHDLTLPEMEVGDIKKVVDVWKAQYIDLGSNDFINHVQIFENKGAVMGCSNPHPHGQIWSQSSLPTNVEKTQANLKKYYEANGRSLLADYLAEELERKERIVLENEHFVVLVPFWAVWPFETLIISKRHFGNLTQMTEEESLAFADAIRRLTIKYDNLFETSFPYSSGIHQSPTDGEDHPEWHMHMHFYPPLLRSASVKKFMVGYELMAEAQRDISPEKSAAMLRELSETHYKHR
ncbi:galactose-1-phosphate uridylyltransferase [Flavobacterium akiainvivens]|uniref:Galactose-1-phosphate uridylyltransferase n=1 Tax=Flavobacterium akiainvivens TaxID=1202724 RepID=A0A0N0RQZ2_9FLAO|nr:UDP-glucose--hexose-1-phosphate uridylyltransferase [Flavobacterium akiainvivens]KOS07422.1 galactose-1-phosphate uridylyltransferase [Flavobacterium akiainvivens]SFQ47971.1 UDPglucose--hexose-1-phosphate uridylyltransferase [Flavobacterium akiainvivens]